MTTCRDGDVTFCLLGIFVLLLVRGHVVDGAQRSFRLDHDVRCADGCQRQRRQRRQWRGCGCGWCSISIRRREEMFNDLGRHNQRLADVVEPRSVFIVVGTRIDICASHGRVLANPIGERPFPEHCHHCHRRWGWGVHFEFDFNVDHDVGQILVTLVRVSSTRRCRPCPLFVSSVLIFLLTDWFCAL